MALYGGSNTVCLDLEVLYSPDALPTGWSDYAALGLSIGGYWDGLDQQIHWFDVHNAVDTMVLLVERQPRIVSFNGIRFDGPLLAAVVYALYGAEVAGWMDLWANSYDILAEVWRTTGRDYARGNSLDALCRANGLGCKSGSGAMAPKLWQAGRVADVLNYCQHDMCLTLALAEHLTSTQGHLRRLAGPIGVRFLALQAPGVWAVVEPEAVP